MEKLERKPHSDQLPPEMLPSSSTAVDAAIDQVLMEAGESAVVDRAYCFRFHDCGLRLSNTNEWCSRGIRMFREKLTDIPVEALPFITSRVRSNQVVLLDRRYDAVLPPKEAVEMIAEGIQSLVIIPLVDHVVGRVVGFVGFDSCSASRSEWTDHDLACLLDLR